MRFGLYCFWDGDVCLYIGMSTDLFTRIEKQTKRFPGARFTVVDRTDDPVFAGMSSLELRRCLQWEEAAAIREFKPIHNTHRRVNNIDILVTLPLAFQREVMETLWPLPIKVRPVATLTS